MGKDHRKGPSTSEGERAPPTVIAPDSLISLPPRTTHARCSFLPKQRRDTQRVPSTRRHSGYRESPFAHRLLELDASGYRCGIRSTALSDCCRLQALNADSNKEMLTLQPFAQRLRELRAGGPSSALSDAALEDATGLVHLSACQSHAITTVEPFGASLRRLDLWESGIGDAGLVTATNLVYLDASFNYNIRSLASFSASLLELRAASGWFSEAATNLIWLNVSENERITTVQWCGRSLRHLVAWGSRCAIANEGLCTATQLVTLDCSRNPTLTAMEPFLQSLEELRSDSSALVREAVCIEVGRESNLHFIKGRLGSCSIAELKVNRFIGRQFDEGFGTIVMYCNTLAYGL